MKSRTVYEMSKGDFLKQETNLRMLKLQNEYEELNHLTLQPKISNKAKVLNKSRIRNTDELIGNYNAKQELLLKKSEDEAKRREEEELAKCTFKPQIRESPAYVKRIFETMKKLKEARSSIISVNSENTKPEWK